MALKTGQQIQIQNQLDSTCRQNAEELTSEIVRELQSAWIKGTGKISEEATGPTRPERANKWPISLNLDDLWVIWRHFQ
jgi:hypothetical protein